MKFACNLCTFQQKLVVATAYVPISGEGLYVPVCDEHKNVILERMKQKPEDQKENKT